MKRTTKKPLPKRKGRSYGKRFFLRCIWSLLLLFGVLYAHRNVPAADGWIQKVLDTSVDLSFLTRGL